MYIQLAVVYPYIGMYMYIIYIYITLTLIYIYIYIYIYEDFAFLTTFSTQLFSEH